MMNTGKRGASHADWAISLGIFLVYILSMLIIIQPGAQPIYKEERLLKIAKDNYKADTEYIFYKTPIIIDTAGMDFAGEGTYAVRLDGDLPFSGDGNEFAVATMVGGALVPVGNFEIVLGAGGRILFNGLVSPGKNTFYVISNARAVGDADTYGRLPASGTEISEAKGNFTLIFGSTEVLAGVDEAQLTSGTIRCSSAEQYTALKGAWDYPSGKDFVTFYAEGSSPRYPALIDVCNQAEPFEQASVFVEEWAANKLDKLGNAEPVRMVVRVW